MRAGIGGRWLTEVGRRARAKLRRRTPANQQYRLGQASHERWRSEVANVQPRLLGVEVKLHEAAVLAAGYHDFGDSSYRFGLARLLGAIGLSDYSPQQQHRIRSVGIVPILTGRLYSQRGWDAHPKCLDDAIEAPLVVCGMPRTGTTALHKLLSMDERFQGLNGWLVAYPMPRPARDDWPAIREYRAVAAGWEAVMSASPKHRAAHFRSADEVDECLELMAQSFVTNQFPAVFRLPGYDNWFRTQDQRPTYRRFADNLRLIGSNEPDKTWLLKNPGHILALDALLEVFPDARIVQTHRHPGAALASITSLLGEVRKSVLGADPPTDDIAPRELGLWSAAVVAALAVRERHPANFHDVDYREFLTDPMDAVHGVYDRFGMTLDNATLLRMRRWIAENPRGKHGAHDYDPGAIGPSDALIERHFGEYMRRFALA
jgi:hypothetical protein